MATSLEACAFHLTLPVSSKAMTSPSGEATTVVVPSLPTPADSLVSASAFQSTRPLASPSLATEPSGGQASTEPPTTAGTQPKPEPMPTAGAHPVTPDMPGGQDR